MKQEPFESLGQLLGYYRFTKMNVRGMKTILPSKDSNFKDALNARAAQSSMEEKYAFIDEVEKFAGYYFKVQKYMYPPIPAHHLLLVFTMRFGDDATFGQLAAKFQRLKEKGEYCPKVLLNRGNTFKIVGDMLKHAKVYFKDRGLITPDPRLMVADEKMNGRCLRNKHF